MRRLMQALGLVIFLTGLGGMAAGIGMAISAHSAQGAQGPIKPYLKANDMFVPGVICGTLESWMQLYTGFETEEEVKRYFGSPSVPCAVNDGSPVVIVEFLTVIRDSVYNERIEVYLAFHPYVGEIYFGIAPGQAQRVEERGA